MPVVDDVTGSTGSPRTDGRAALMLAARQELADHGPAGLSLRAVARRAGVSHAAPKHHFVDRAGLLTALAVEGFRLLSARFRAVEAAAPGSSTDPLLAIGQAYLDFSLAEPDLFEVMFGTEPLHADDPDLMAERRYTFTVLSSNVTGADPRDPSAYGRPVPVASLTAWAMIHGLVMITRDGSLQRITGTATAEQTIELARGLAETFTAVLRRAEL